MKLPGKINLISEGINDSKYGILLRCLRLSCSSDQINDYFTRCSKIAGQLFSFSNYQDPYIFKNRKSCMFSLNDKDSLIYLVCIVKMAGDRLNSVSFINKRNINYF